MFCNYCRSEVGASYKYCPQCGVHLTADSISPHPTPSQEPTPLASPNNANVMKKKSMPLWFKLASFLAVVALMAVTAGILFTESWVDVVDHQLVALRNQDVPKAYSYTSADFQTTTPLEDFRRFVDTYPIFSKNQSAHFTQRSIEGNVGTLKGLLTSNDHTNTPIEYKLIKEENGWKILSIRLLKPDHIRNPNEADQTAALIESAKAQLVCIQEEKWPEAYRRYSSKEFQEATSEEAFIAFIKRYPILTDYHAFSCHKPSIRNGIGTLSVILQSDETAAYVKYYFIDEDHCWKMWSMRILSSCDVAEGKQEARPPPSEPEPNKPLAPPPMSFGKILLGDTLQEDGQITCPRTLFRSSVCDLYVDIEIKNSCKYGVVYLNLQHLESDSTIPAKAEIEENGHTVLMSVFSPPASGWPKGHYKLLAALSSGPTTTVEFEME